MLSACRRTEAVSMRAPRQGVLPHAGAIGSAVARGAHVLDSTLLDSTSTRLGNPYRPLSPYLAHRSSASRSAASRASAAPSTRAFCHACSPRTAVVGEPGHLGDRQGGCVGEPIAVPDDELVERVARVEGGAGGDHRALGRRRRGGARPVRRHQFDLHSGAEDGLGARAQHAREAPADPRPDRIGRLDDEHPGLERAWHERLQPDVPGGVADRTPQLMLDAMPGVWEFVGGHRGAEWPPPGRRWGGKRWYERPQKGPGGANIAMAPSPAGAWSEAGSEDRANRARIFR